MTLIEFLAHLKKKTNQALVLGILFYKEQHEGLRGLTLAQIRDALRSARVRRHAQINLSDVFIKSGALVDARLAADSAKVWFLTETGKKWIYETSNSLLPNKENEHDVHKLRAVISKIQSADIKDYLEEAVKCFEVGALRAGVVFVWVAAIRLIQTELLKHSDAKVNASIQAHYQKAKYVSSIDHFAYIDDSVTLLAARDLGIFDKSEYGVLKEALDLRNKCGHPGKYKPGINKINSFLEDIVNVLRIS